MDAYELRKQVNKALARDELKSETKTKTPKLSLTSAKKPKAPTPVRLSHERFSTYEAIGELQIANPMGLLVERDELVSLLKQLDRDEQAAARGVLSFRIGQERSRIRSTASSVDIGNIEAVCISVLGNTQPGAYRRICPFRQIAEVPEATG